MADPPVHTGEDETPIPGVDFHHIGLALRRPTDLWPVMAGSLGGRYVGRGIESGYGWTQLRFANGFVVEGLHPETSDGNDFLQRFLDRSGPGPHHLTFHVEDLDAAIGALTAAGYDPIVSDTSGHDWRQAVLHPARAHGIVVQVVHPGAPPAVPPEEPEGFPHGEYDQPVAALGRVVHAVEDLESAQRLYRDLLGGRILSTGSAVDGNHWVELGWGGPGRLRLLEGVHGDIAEWIGSRHGRLRHLFFSFDEPSYVPGAYQVAPGRWVVDAEEVLGTRFVLSPSAR